MDDSIILISFDINSTHEENNEDKNKSNESLMESPDRIFEEFFLNHKQTQMDKKKTKRVREKIYIFSKFARHVLFSNNNNKRFEFHSRNCTRYGRIYNIY